MHHAVCQMGNAYQGDGFVHHSLVLFRKSSPETGVGATPQTYQFYDGVIIKHQNSISQMARGPFSLQRSSKGLWSSAESASMVGLMMLVVEILV